MRIALQVITAAVVSVAAPVMGEILSQTDVFVGGGEPNGVSVYRLPGAGVAVDGSIVAFAEARHNGQDPGYPGSPISLVMKRSTDGGASWSPLQVRHIDPNFDYSDPRVFVDYSTGKMYVMYTQWPDGFNTSNIPPGLGANSAQMFLQTSVDNGVTWSSPANITNQVKNPLWGELDNAPGAGIQLQWQNDPQRNGRLLSPPWRTQAGKSTANLSIYSDDGGSSWKSGEVAPGTGTGSEATVVELTDGRLLMDVRGGAVRGRTISSDGGQTWGAVFNSDVPVAQVHAALVRYSAARSGHDRDRILFSAPLGEPAGTGNGRSNIGIWTSYDEGKTFINPVMIVAGYGGYSVLQRLNDDTISLLYETVGGTSIQSVNFNLAHLEGAAHEAGLTHYDGFGNSVNRLRGGLGWSGAWIGNGHAVNANETAFGGSSSVPFPGFKFDMQPGRMDFKPGGPNEAYRNLTGAISLDREQTSYVSLLLSQKLDASADDSVNEFFRVELRDAKGVPQATFGVKDDESFFVGGLGADISTPPDAMTRSQSYFLVAKITSHGSGPGKFDQISLKAFASGGGSIPDNDMGLDWTLVGAANKNSASVLQQIALVSGSQAWWSIDEVRIGSTFGAVASNLAGGDFPNGVSGDVNQDGVTTGDGTGPAASDDLTAFLQGWQSTTAGLPPLERVRNGDLNLDGKVDLNDARLLRHALLLQGETFDFSKVPEPSSITLTLATSLAWLALLR